MDLERMYVQHAHYEAILEWQKQLDDWGVIVVMP